jgi:Secretin and TonB N terminus short domain
VGCDPDRTRSQAPEGSRSCNQASAWLLLCLMASSFAVLIQPAGAQSPEPEIQFDLPVEPLDTALEAYMQITGSQVLYRSALTNARVSTALKGRFTPTQALAKLLAGTSLTARYTTEGAFTIIPVSIVQPGAAREVARYEAYLGDAQNRIIAALCSDVGTRPGTYRAALQFSINASGLIEDAVLLGTTGDRTRDQEIAAALHGIPMGEGPPTSMPQPVTMLITPRASGLPNECRSFAR